MPPSEARAPSFPRQVLLVLHKDLVVEWRSREIIYTMVFFAALVVLIFAFAFADDGQPMAQVAGGILWVVVAFSGTLGLGRIFHRELDGETHLALLLSPTSPAALYLGKLLGVMLLAGLTEAVVVPMITLLFNLRVHSLPLLLALLALGTAGFAAVGCLLAAALMHGRGREALLGALLYPIVTPVIIAGSKGTAALMAGPAEAAGVMGRL